MNRLRSFFIFSLTFVFAFSTVGTFGLSNVQASQLKDEEISFDQDYYDFKILEDGILIDGKFYSPEEFEEYLKSAEIVILDDNNGSSFVRAFALAPAVYFVPGIGQVALLGTGAIVVGGVTVAAGSWLYKTISNYFNDPKKVISSTYGIPTSLLESNGNVKLGSFKDKHGNTPLTKKSGTFKNGKWTVEKDTAGHGGRAWKLKKDGKRKASLDKNGKVLSK